MITREQIKAEIDALSEEYVDLVHRVIKSLEPATSGTTVNRAAWQSFIEQTYGSTAPAPISRGDQRRFETREDVQ